MIEIFVDEPVKTHNTYQFVCRIKEEVKTSKSLPESTFKFGYLSRGFDIKHSELWDSIYPMLFLTRNGGPIFQKYDKAVIQFNYPILQNVRDFYEKRAKQFGLDVKIEGESFNRTYDLKTSGSLLAFGGGKDSRMLLGVLQELGRNPIPITSGLKNTGDLPQALVTTPIHGALGDRIMPGLMMLGETLYIGTGLGEAHLKTPWQQYFDWASPGAMADFSDLLRKLGVKMSVHAPATVLPYNIIQKILYSRYPELYEYQNSVPKDKRCEKNLHIALCKLQHGISSTDHCNPTLFRSLLKKFVRKQIAEPSNFGFRDHREVFNKEMRSIIHRFKNHPSFTEVSGLIPSNWQGNWIDYIHAYAYKDLEPEILKIYQQYALDIPMSDNGGPDYLVSV